MQVVLLERVPGLGQVGSVVRVRPGYARNFLLPGKKALRATPGNIRRFEQDRARIEAADLAKRDEAAEAAARIEGMTVSLIRQASDGGHLYGSVSARDVAAALEEAGCVIGRNQVQLAVPVKALGIFPVRLTLHPDVFATVIVNVARNETEAETALAAWHRKKDKEAEAARPGQPEDEDPARPRAGA